MLPLSLPLKIGNRTRAVCLVTLISLGGSPNTVIKERLGDMLETAMGRGSEYRCYRRKGRVHSRFDVHLRIARYWALHRLLETYSNRMAHVLCIPSVLTTVRLDTTFVCAQSSLHFLDCEGFTTQFKRETCQRLRLVSSVLSSLDVCLTPTIRYCSSAK